MRTLRSAAFAVAGAIALTASHAAAEPVTNQQLAQKLFDQARDLIEKGETSRACEMFTESQRLDPGAGTLLNLALCHQSEGKLGTAYFELQESLAQALRDGNKDREAIATEHLAVVNPRVPKVTIVGPREAIAGFVVELDGVPVRAAALGVPLQADPGSHSLRATAPARSPWISRVELREKDDVRVEIPVLAPAADSAPRTRTTRSFSTATYVVGGVAVAALATSAITGILALGAQSAYENACFTERSYCKDAAGVDQATATRNYAWVSTGALLVGVAAGVTAFFLPRDVRVIPIVEQGGAGATVRASF